MTSKARGASQGFTIAEIMVVLFIIIIISAASIPMGLNFVRHYKITGAAQGLASEIQRARAQAVKRNSSRGILLNFNYPDAGQYQFTSLDPNPLTGNWDGAVYPANPGIFDRNVTVDYGMVPQPTNNVVDPDLSLGVQSPHGMPIELPTTVDFEAGERNALLFLANGTVAAVNAGGAAGGAAVTRVPDGQEWMVILRDSTTDLARVVRVSPGGRVRVEQLPVN
ncbi:MAG: pilus assembly FimT family protein [Vicinamibacteria bacterium]